MEGYSVTEAASVLGVPTERVWELLARGVLSGAPEGESGMRVYLQPRPAPAPVEARGPNGDGGGREPERELSPFRELLTEFRNLTERYGQALLALGEARGEVASLRSRVDLLEARMDLRLPMGQPQPAGWSSTPPMSPAERDDMPSPSAEPAVTAPAEPGEAAGASAVENEERRGRARGPRRATESFAAALARAEDPSPPELPGGVDAAAAPAGLPREPEPGADVGLPREVAGADAIPVADVAGEVVPLAAAPMAELDAGESVTAESAVVQVIPEPVAVPEPAVEEGHTTVEPDEEAVPPAATEAPATEVEAPAEVEPVGLEAAKSETEALAPIETNADAVEAEVGQFEAERDPVQTGAERDRAVDIELEPDPARNDAEAPAFEPAPAPEPDAPSALTDDAESAAGASDVEPIGWDAERYTTDIEEPDWLAAETTEVVERAPAPVDPSGADEMEVAPTGTQHDAPAVPSGPARSFPGAPDLEAAIAALRAAGRSAEPLPAPDPEAEIEPDDDENDEWPPHSALGRPPSAPGTAARGSASRAYRRLRRIFPG